MDSGLWVDQNADLREIARSLFAGKECHAEEFDELWRWYQANTYYRPELAKLTCMARWERKAWWLRLLRQGTLRAPQRHA